mmetsp:Transcript_35544/g.112142  ORF Transcript_35544/g.112142 Transcript_35544/m.112142 type:complete len:230 (-) Transcript_35544:100-789(-)
MAARLSPPEEPPQYRRWEDRRPARVALSPPQALVVHRGRARAGGCCRPGSLRRPPHGRRVAAAGGPAGAAGRGSGGGHDLGRQPPGPRARGGAGDPPPPGPAPPGREEDRLAAGRHRRRRSDPTWGRGRRLCDKQLGLPRSRGGRVGGRPQPGSRIPSLPPAPGLRRKPRGQEGQPPRARLGQGRGGGGEVGSGSPVPRLHGMERGGVGSGPPGYGCGEERDGTQPPGI